MFRILLYGAHDADKGLELGRISLVAEAVSLVYHGSRVFVGLANGHLNVYNRNIRYIVLADWGGMCGGGPGGFSVGFGIWGNIHFWIHFWKKFLEIQP